MGQLLSSSSNKPPGQDLISHSSTNVSNSWILFGNPMGILLSIALQPFIRRLGKGYKLFRLSWWSKSTCVCNQSWIWLTSLYCKIAIVFQTKADVIYFFSNQSHRQSTQGDIKRFKKKWQQPKKFDLINIELIANKASALVLKIKLIKYRKICLTKKVLYIQNWLYFTLILSYKPIENQFSNF
jgi:hypothetical protein